MSPLIKSCIFQQYHLKLQLSKDACGKQFSFGRFRTVIIWALPTAIFFWPHSKKIDDGLSEIKTRTYLPNTNYTRSCNPCLNYKNFFMMVIGNEFYQFAAWFGFSLNSLFVPPFINSALYSLCVCFSVFIFLSLSTRADVVCEIRSISMARGEVQGKANTSACYTLVEWGFRDLLLINLRGKL